MMMTTTTPTKGRLCIPTRCGYANIRDHKSWRRKRANKLMCGLYCTKITFLQKSQKRKTILFYLWPNFFYILHIQYTAFNNKILHCNIAITNIDKLYQFFKKNFLKGNPSFSFPKHSGGNNVYINSSLNLLYWCSRPYALAVGGAATAAFCLQGNYSWI